MCSNIATTQILSTTKQEKIIFSFEAVFIYSDRHRKWNAVVFSVSSGVLQTSSGKTKKLGENLKKKLQAELIG